MQKEYLCNAYHVCYVVPTATEVLPNYRLVRLITPECIYYVKFGSGRTPLGLVVRRLWHRSSDAFTSTAARSHSC
jgi:hypothetical protein